jgi:hypothetical protein
LHGTLPKVGHNVRRLIWAKDTSIENRNALQPHCGDDLVRIDDWNKSRLDLQSHGVHQIHLDPVFPISYRHKVFGIWELWVIEHVGSGQVKLKQLIRFDQSEI